MVIICGHDYNYFCWNISPKILDIGTFMAYVVIYLYAGWRQECGFYLVNLMPFFIHPSTHNCHSRRKKPYTSVMHSFPMKYTIILELQEEGGYTVTVPALPGCISEGDTKEEAIENIKDAISGYIESLKKHGETIPAEVSVEVPIDA